MNENDNGNNPKPEELIDIYEDEQKGTIAVLKTKGCKHCRFSKQIATCFDPGCGSDFVECPYCGDDTDFSRVMGWAPRDIVRGLSTSSS